MQNFFLILPSFKLAISWIAASSVLSEVESDLKSLDKASRGLCFGFYSSGDAGIIFTPGANSLYGRGLFSSASW